MSNNKPAIKAAEKTMPVGPTTVVVEMKRAMKCGKHMLDVGTPIAVIKLQPGVSLNYLSRALEDGIAGAVK